MNTNDLPTRRGTQENDRMAKLGKRTCSKCNWTNVGLLNLGEPGKPRWVCLGCCKRAIETLDAAKSLAKRWRARAEQLRREIPIARNGDVADGITQEAESLDDCAAELEMTIAKPEV